MGDPISSLPNLGPSTEAQMNSAGIHTVEQLRALGADVAYGRLLENGVRPHFIGYYVLVMALQGRPWNDCKGDEKKALRKRFDAIKSTCRVQGISHELNHILNQIGVVEKP